MSNKTGSVFYGGMDSKLNKLDASLDINQLKSIDLINGIQVGIIHNEFIICGIWGPDIL